MHDADSLVDDSGQVDAALLCVAEHSDALDTRLLSTAKARARLLLLVSALIVSTWVMASA